MPVKQPWSIYINRSHKYTATSWQNHNKTKHIRVMCTFYGICCVVATLEWRHNGRDSVSNHQPHDCLLNRLFRRRPKKTSKLHVTGLCAGPVNSPHKWPVTRKMFPFDDVIMSKQRYIQYISQKNLDSVYISEKSVYKVTSLNATSQIVTRAKMYHDDIKYGCCMYFFFFSFCITMYLLSFSSFFPLCLPYSFSFFFHVVSLFLYCPSSFIIVVFDDTHL